MAQVRHHQESTERQYALKHKALELGWTQAQICTLDGDLGVSGAQMTDREDFKTLVADVSLGHVGAVFALESARLGRSCADWHRLLELCALTDTLIIDEDGCYDVSDFNDQLLLGLKGTMSQAELHFMRAPPGRQVEQGQERGAALPLGFPKRAYGGIWKGQLIWGRLTHRRTLEVLKNPSYAGIYVFGRYRYRKQLSAEGAFVPR